jgi:hypothetical protein
MPKKITQDESIALVQENQPKLQLRAAQTTLCCPTGKVGWEALSGID